MPAAARHYDLAVIGAGINGAGVARDAAGRGLNVLLVEQNDIAGATSQWSTKLVHGGLRYLEQFQFRLVRESLAEREVLLRCAPHLVQPLAFVLPHEPHLRPAWIIRAGLCLYDHLGRRETLPASFTVDLTPDAWGAGLKPTFRKGFVYADARVDDARLVVVNVMAARQLGADVRVRTRFAGATRDGNRWLATLIDANGVHEAVGAQAIVNAAGPWVKEVRDAVSPSPARENVRHVKGSHIVVPRVHSREHAYLLQNADGRIVFVIPFEERFSLIGTTDIDVDQFEHPHISDEEIDYLLRLANSYLDQPLTRDDIVWTFAGVRPLYDDGSVDPSAITRDYVFRIDAEMDRGIRQAPALLSIFGGKLTTYRRLAEHAVAEVKPFLPSMRPAWTSHAPLPGGDLAGRDLAQWTSELIDRYPAVAPSIVRSIVKRHGSRAAAILDQVNTIDDPAAHFGSDLTAAEVDYVIREEWARTADDVLWRRTKCGLGMPGPERERLAAYVASRLTSLRTAQPA